jgi:hypothetical protein
MTTAQVRKNLRIAPSGPLAARSSYLIEAYYGTRGSMSLVTGVETNVYSLTFTVPAGEQQQLVVNVGYVFAVASANSTDAVRSRIMLNGVEQVAEAAAFGQPIAPLATSYLGFSLNSVILLQPAITNVYTLLLTANHYQGVGTPLVRATASVLRFSGSSPVTQLTNP